jgi:hypothetical protein
MPTHVYTKQKLIDLIERDFTDDDIFLLTTEFMQAQYSKKSGCNKVTYAFGEDAFKYKGDVRVFFNNPTFAMAVIREDDISEHANILFKQEK